MERKASTIALGNAKNRNSSFEILRIIAMLSIIFCHFATHGKFEFNTQLISIPRLWWYLIEIGGNWGNNIFVLISGYFLVENKNDFFNYKRIFIFWGQVFFYSISIYILFLLLGFNEFSFISLIKALFPITFETWWFTSTYFVLYLLHPFINTLLHTLDKTSFRNFVLLLLIIWCLIPTFTFCSYQSNNFLWFVTLYCVAAYIRKFGLNSQFTRKHYIILFIFSSLLRYLSAIVLIMIGTKIPFAVDHALAFYGKQSILTFLSALSAFMIFQQTKFKHSKWINTIASTTFGVYLIHDNPTIRSFLWTTVFDNASFQNTIYLIPYSIFAVVIVFVACVMIDLIRKSIFKKLSSAFCPRCMI